MFFFFCTNYVASIGVNVISLFSPCCGLSLKYVCDRSLMFKCVGIYKKQTNKTKQPFKFSPLK